MKAILEFDLDDYEDKEKFALANNAQNMDFAFDDIHRVVWRGYFKHGYTGRLQEIIDKHLKEDGENDVTEAIEILHNLYLGCLRDNGVNNHG